MPRRAVLAIVACVTTALVALALAACSAFVPPPEPACDPTELGHAPALSCATAVEAALDALPSHGPIAGIVFQYGSICPPNARCMPPDGSTGTVIVTFGDGTHQSVYVRLEGGRLIADPPEPYPPSWADV